MSKRILFERMRHNIFFVVGFTVGVLILLIVFLSPLYVQFDPIANALTQKFLPPEGFSNGFSGHILGTDNMGRDVFTRLVIGGRLSLMIAIAVVTLQTLLGVVLGMIAGYYGGAIDAIIMRACDVVLAIPNLILAIAIMAVLGSNIYNMIFVLIFAGWVHVCKVTRNNVRIAKTQEFVHASTALGAKGGHIMFRQILPNVTTHILIIGSQRFAYVILLEAALSFLSLGIQPPTPAWGNMISAGRAYMTTYPWMVFAPGIALMLTVLSFNFLGDGLRDVLDTKRKV